MSFLTSFAHQFYMSRVLCWLAVALGLLAVSTRAAVMFPYYDGFNYTSGSGLAGQGSWVAASGSGTIQVGTAGLNYVGLVDGSGKDVTIIPAGTAARTYVNFPAQSSGSFYLSFLLKVNVRPGSQTLLGFASSSTSSDTTPSLGIFIKATGELAVSINTSTPQFSSASPLNLGQTNLVVIRYTFGATDTADVWLNPTSLGGTAPALTGTASGTDTATLQYFLWNTLSGSGGSFEVDEFRMGTNYAEVTPTGSAPPPPITNIPVFTQAQLAGGQLVLRGTNGNAGNAYEILCSSNLAAPVAQWLVVGSNTFSATGGFASTNSVNTFAAQLFYRLRVGGSSGATNPPPGTPPSIVTQPQSNSVSVGGTAMFSVAATGSAPLRYQWFFNNAAASGATNSSLTLVSVATNQAGNYFVRVTNDFGAVTSSIVALTVNPAPTGAVFYVSTTGSDSNPGTLAAPFATVSKAQSVMAVGDTIYLRGGTYNLSAQVKLTLDGTATSYCKLWAYPGERPVFDFSTTASGVKGLYLNANYWHVKGIEVANATDNGIIVAGADYCIVEGCVVHDCNNDGIRIGSSTTLANYTLILNCDSFRNYQAAAHGNNGDGFSAKAGTGVGNVFRGCRAWNNSDDGWDFYDNDVTITLEGCITWANGLNLWGDSAFTGNGNGFKLGGASTHSQHILRNCLAIQNVHDGFDQNYNSGGVTLYNCTGYGNEVNFQFPDTPSVGVDVIKNCVSFNGINAINGAAQLTSNSWQGFTVTAADFAGLDTSSVTNARNADYSLPTLPLLRLVPGSDLIDAGVDVGIPFIGPAPDLGAYEYAP